MGAEGIPLKAGAAVWGRALGSRVSLRRRSVLENMLPAHGLPSLGCSQSAA